MRGHCIPLDALSVALGWWEKRSLSMSVLYLVSKLCTSSALCGTQCSSLALLAPVSANEAEESTRRFTGLQTGVSCVDKKGKML